MSTTIPFVSTQRVLPFKLAQRMANVQSSTVREILKVTEQPEIISFAGGLPAPELFPVDAIAAAYDSVLTNAGAASLQYSTSEGFLPLREAISARLNKFSAHTNPNQLLITNGSQQGLDLVAKVLLDPGDFVVVESPCYLAALQTFSAYEAQFAVIDSDEYGMCVDQLEAIIWKYQPKLIYLVPNFNNPTGITLALERRLELIRLAQKHQVIVLEDNPYGELRFQGEHLPSLLSLDDQGVVISLGTFSKTFAPGLRIGWLTATEQLTSIITVAKQTTDLHTTTISQRVIAHLMQTFDYEGHIAKIRTVYGQRASAMLTALAENFPTASSWTKPHGGMFLWVTLPIGTDGTELLQRAILAKVAFVPGSTFFAEKPRHECIRLNFSNQSNSAIAEGIRRIARLLD